LAIQGIGGTTGERCGGAQSKAEKERDERSAEHGCTSGGQFISFHVAVDDRAASQNRDSVLFMRATGCGFAACIFSPWQRRGDLVQVLVRDNNVDQALRALKKKMQREGVFREMKLRRNYEKPSERRAREKAEAVRRYRKLLRKRMEREGY
jgi:small subunit ribosomal protein S21